MPRRHEAKREPRLMYSYETRTRRMFGISPQGVAREVIAQALIDGASNIVWQEKR